jgi:phage terminase small subunit
VNKNDISQYDGSTPLTGPHAVMQEMFISNLLSGMTKWDAYQKAGYRTKNASKGAIQLVKNSKVAVRLAFRRAELQAQMRRETGITEKRVLDEISYLAFSNMRDFIQTDEDNNIIFRDFDELTREQMAAVESVKITKTTTTNKKGDREYTTQHTQFKLHPKTANLDQLCKHLGLFQKDNDQRRSLTLVDILAIVGGKTVEVIDSSQNTGNDKSV